MSCGPDAFTSPASRRSVAALDRTPDGQIAPAPPRRDGRAGPADWLRDLEGRRGALADAADERMAGLAPADRRDACKGAVTAAFDEIGEMTAFLEQMPPHRAVRRLELAREDLERLGESGRLWAGEAAIGLEPGRRADLGRGPRAVRARKLPIP